jgi:hypothetical protein
MVDRLGLSNRHLVVCDALRYHREEFERRARVELVSEDGPNPGGRTEFLYRLL